MPVTMLVAHGTSSGIFIPHFECTESKWRLLPSFASADARGTKISSWNNQHFRAHESGLTRTESYRQCEYRDKMSAWHKLVIQQLGAGPLLSHSAVAERRLLGRASTFSRCATDSLHNIATHRLATQVAEGVDVSDTR